MLELEVLGWWVLVGVDRARAATPIRSSRRRPIRSPSVPLVISEPATAKP